jgi:hypothetical protein
MNRFVVVVLCVGLCLLLLISGCHPRLDISESIITPHEGEYLVSILIDLSGSFSEMMATDGHAYDFLLQILDRYFRDRIGTNDQIVISQISGGTNRSLLWQGTPVELRQRFPTADAFRVFLLSKADAAVSRVYDALSQTVEYTMSDSNVVSGKAKSAVFCLTDMLDTSVDQSKERAVKALNDYGRMGGVVGIYFCEQGQVAEWRQILTDAGIRNSCVEPEFVGHPKLPSFD